jgi:hypothetical protein
MSLKPASETIMQAAVQADDDVVDDRVPTAMELALRQAMDTKETRRGRDKKRDRDRRDRYDMEQEDIIMRTLRSHSK